jgi:hypothetical protein
MIYDADSENHRYIEKPIGLPILRDVNQLQDVRAHASQCLVHKRSVKSICT